MLKLQINNTQFVATIKNKFLNYNIDNLQTWNPYKLCDTWNYNMEYFENYVEHTTLDCVLVKTINNIQIYKTFVLDTWFVFEIDKQRDITVFGLLKQ